MKVYKLRPDARLPEKNDEDMCYDLFAAIDEPVEVKWGEVAIINTGLMFDPSPYHFSIRPRSGLAVKHGVHILAGQIDKSYRGELLVAMTTLKKDYTYVVCNGDKIAQFKLEHDVTVDVEEVYAEHYLSDSLRGEGGFGSTGG